mgnify:CR=1 FL=1
MVKAVVGANWGDEGKGKITDMLAKQADIIVRFQGGANAGHTIVNDYGKFALHTLPSGVFYSHTTSVIGNGVALDIPRLFKEIKSITDRNVPMPKILVSNRAQIVMPYHVLFDQYEEERLGGKSFGSTKSGIAPFYSDKYAKIGFQVSELFDDELLKEKVVRVAEQKNVILEHLYHKPLIDTDELLNTLHEYRDMVAPYVCDVSLFLDKALKEGKTVLLEGQLGTLKDPDHGIYPMVTSSSTLAGYGAIGAGIPPYEIKQIVTVCKAYSSAVGAGAFVSEIFGEEADELRRRGGDGGEFVAAKQPHHEGVHKSQGSGDEILQDQRQSQQEQPLVEAGLPMKMTKHKRRNLLKLKSKIALQHGHPRVVVAPQGVRTGVDVALVSLRAEAQADHPAGDLLG